LFTLTGQNLGTNANVFLFLAVLKGNVDFLNSLIFAEGTRLLQEDGTGKTPQALLRRGGFPNRLRKAKCLEQKSTA
jgi:hypothetical protein